MSDALRLDGFTVMLGKEVREAWRTGKLPIVVGIFFVLGLASPLLAYETPALLQSLGTGGVTISVPAPTVADAVDQFLKNVAGDGVFIGILAAMGLIAREHERGTTAFVLTKPVTRLAFVLAKAVAIALVLALGIIAAGVAGAIYTPLLFAPGLQPGFVAACALVLLQLLSYAVLTLAGSALVRSTVAAGGIGIAAFAALAVVGAFPALARFTPAGLTEPARALALGQATSHLGTALVANVIIILASVALAWQVIERKEIAPTE